MGRRQVPGKEGRGRGHTEQSEGTGGRVGNAEGGEVPKMGAMAQLLRHRHHGWGLSIDTDTSALPRAQHPSLPGSCAERYGRQERKRAKTQPLTPNVGGLAGDGSRGARALCCDGAGREGKGNEKEGNGQEEPRTEAGEASERPAQASRSPVTKRTNLPGSD